jgi:cation transport ATPase
MDRIVSSNKIIYKVSFPVTGMSCAACASSVESILANTSIIKMERREQFGRQLNKNT